jgi:hypothetical protein
LEKTLLVQYFNFREEKRNKKYFNVTLTCGIMGKSSMKPAHKDHFSLSLSHSIKQIYNKIIQCKKVEMISAIHESQISYKYDKHSV